MIEHPTNKELAAQKRFPSVEETYAQVGLGKILPKSEKDPQWIARKSHKSSFRDPRNRSSYEPKTNTARLVEYEEGLGEALELLKSAKTRIFDTEKKDMSYADMYAMGALSHAVDHLKGKDINPALSATRTLQDENSAIWIPRPNNESKDFDR